MSNIVMGAVSGPTENTIIKEMRHCGKHKLGFLVEMKKVPWGKFFAVGTCPRCEEELKKGESVKKKQDEEWHARQLCRQLGVRERYADVSLSNYVAHTPSQTAAKRTVEELVSSPKGQILILSGPNGVGKTHLLCAGLLMAKKGLLVTMMEMAIRIRSIYSGIAEETEFHILDELIRKPILAIDEIDKAKGTKSEHDWLTYLVSERHARLRPTILASNRHFILGCPTQQADGCDLCLENLIGESIINRVTWSISIDGPDYRLDKTRPETKPEKGDIK